MATFGQLAQDTTAAATAEELYALPAATTASGLTLTVCNVNGTADTFSVYQKDSGGTPWPDSTALYKDNAILGNETLKLHIGPMATAGATIACESAAAQGCTFTLYGTERIEVTKQLEQLRPGSTSNTSLYLGSSANITALSMLKICNQSGSDALARVFHDQDGPVYSKNNAIYWDLPVAADETVEVAVGTITMNGAGGIGVRTSVASALTFTIYGTET